MLRELFYYILGGITFLPLCLVAGLVHFHLTCPPLDAQDAGHGISPDVELTQERKVMALDLAAANAALVSELESNRGKDRPQGSSTAPAAAKRLGPGPAPSAGTKPHLSGPLVVRPRFAADADVAATAAAASTTAAAPSSSSLSNSDLAGNSSDAGRKPASNNANAGPSSSSAGGTSYMTQMYKGLLDYRKMGTKRTLPPSADSKGTQPGQNGASGPTSATGTGTGTGSGAGSDTNLTGTVGRESFHCILKAPILYLYSSDDVSDPSTECHAAIDLRGKRVSIFVAGLGDTMGEPDTDEEDDDDDDRDNDDDDQNRPNGGHRAAGGDGADDGASRNQRQGHPSTNKPQPGPLAAVKDAAGAYDTQSSAGSDAEALPAANADGRRAASKLARAGWKKAKRVAVRDGELFMKRNAIRILGNWTGRSAGSKSQRSAPGQGRQQRPQWFIFCKSTNSMEDWYHALLQASFMPESGPKAGAATGVDGGGAPTLSLRPGQDPLDPVFSKEDMASLLVSLDSLPDPIPLRWLNAMVGRIFYSVYRTAWLEDYITRKMMKKISRVKTPGFLGDIKVQEVDVGRRAPGFSRPMLKSLTSDGEASMEVACHYVGEVRITIATSVTISLGSRFKPYTIPLVLAVVLRSLEGNLLLQVKPPPSNRLWFGFTSLPKMEIDVEPVVSARKVQWGMVTRLIEGRIRELLTESIVVPNMDDVPFFDTRGLPHRGAIFGDAAKRPDDSLSTAASNEVAKAAQPDAATAATAATAAVAAAAQRGHQSAPASGATTPSSVETKQLNGPSADGGAATSTATADRGDAASLRNRKSSNLKAAQDPSHPQQQHRLSSPAAAGLSDLLSRDLAAGGSLSNDKLSTSPSRSDSRLSQQQQQQQHSQPQQPQQQQQSQNRKSWFGGGSRQSATPGPTPSSSLPPGSRSRGGKGREQSSLAWGNASLSHVPGRSLQPQQQSSPKLEPMQDLVAADGQNQGAGTAVDAGFESHRRNNKSISSISSSALGTDESGASALTDRLDAPAAVPATEATEAASKTGADLAAPDQGSDAPTPRAEHYPGSTTSSSKAPSLMVSKASEEDVAALGGDSGEAASHEARPDSALAIETGGRQEPLIDSPSSLVGSGHQPRSSSPSSLGSDLRLVPADHDAGDADDAEASADEDNDGTSLSKSLGASGRSMGGYDGSSISRTSSSPSVASGVKSTHGFAPPPRRTAAAPPTRRDNDAAKANDSASSGLGAAYQSRYGLGGASDASSLSSPSSEGPASATTALLLSSWTKAKASMADKESRQAAAKDAKDAIKRGWASWNSKRNDRGGGNSSGFSDVASTATASSNRSSGLLSSASNSSRFSLTPSRSSWYGNGSSPPADPTSMGTGLESGQHGSRSGSHSSIAASASAALSEAERRAHLRRSGIQDEVDDSGSARSSSSGRQPYRELRASKAAHQGGPRPDYDQPAADPSSTSSGQWSVSVPSLAAPAPALQRQASENSGHQRDAREPNRGHGDYPARGEARGLEGSQGSPVNTVPRRRVSSTASSGAGGGVSFMPPAPTTTTGLASTSSFSGSTLSPIEGQSPLPTPPTDPMRGSSPEEASGLGLRQPPPTAQAEPAARSDEAFRSPASSASDKRTPRADATTTLSPEMHTTSPRLYGSAVVGAGGMATPSSPSMGGGAKVQTQPGRAAMMAVPGIPSMQKSIPQSFSAPPPTEAMSAASQPPQPRTSGSPTMTRMGSMFRMSGLGSEGGGQAVDAKTSGGAVDPGTVTANPLEDELPVPSAAVSGDGRGIDQATDRAPADDAAGGLGLTNLTPSVSATEVAASSIPEGEADDAAPSSMPGETDDGETVSGPAGVAAAAMPAPARGVGEEVAAGGPGPSQGKSQQPTPTEQGEVEGVTTDDDGAGTFAEVAAAEGPAVDREFAESQLDMGPAVAVGSSEVKLDDGSRQRPQREGVSAQGGRPWIH
ncbi:uncharacterized protein PFL1_03487 [Pseudozyma flocculosa PF-1]|uniref:SMP-LTD domain-containing protein n=2 Tax=Pseudozyma flocculosa TaxID=84751 RepID=A0A5C3FAL9_9BASI|nr:uncharacterized protein PFL1_03487 [Pseudozyma flocculosa PF-1]EPQ29200.1 hypothetical protein PFL1_03487 [Pseudozyma flocculosa PF-1]SPO41498.1 uncharacterized protein PSFLO_06980 [Pseudozyma flocculosa]